MTTQFDNGTARRGVIVIGVDFSATSDRATAAGFTLVRENPGTDVHLVHVAVARSGKPDDPRAHANLLQLDEFLQGVARRYFMSSRAGRPRIFTHVLQGSP
ncbi:MAG TPA: universal stress protein, partial [Chloroflexota bacterium]|nr:universal stress protein [Chloroflexota bacterium]